MENQAKNPGEKKKTGWIRQEAEKLTHFKEHYERAKKKEKEIKEKRKDKIRQQRKYMLRNYIEKAGLSIKEERVTKTLFNFCIIINLIISAYLIYFFSFESDSNLVFVVIVMAIVWALIFFGVLFLVWLLFYLMLDFRIFQRKTSIEDVLADFLQLTSANIRAGMPIDRALWFSVRPRFGVLANEIEIVAKETMSGKDLETALTDFTKKYDSPLLKRSMSLLIEGLRAGGEVGELLNKISTNISESRIMKKEMSANVTTYVIFITFATVAAAPVLFALSNQLLHIIHSIVSTISLPSGGVAGFGASFTTLAIKPSDFRLFSVIMLTVTSFFSAAIVAIIRRGSVKAGLKYIPSFIITAVILFYISDFFLGKVLGSMLLS